jgi:tRNA dimethylallyltransferase
VALEVAEWLGAEIVSVDSMQVYRGMDVGTAKPAAADRERVPHHLIDIVEPEHAFTVAEFQAAGRRVLADLRRRSVPALVVGGSGLHFRSLVDPLEFPPSDAEVRAEIEALGPEAAVEALVADDPEVGAVVDLQNPRRVTRALEIFRLTGRTPSERAATEEAEAVRSYRSLFPLTVVGFDPGERLRDRVQQRFGSMISAGLVEEVRVLAPRLGPTASKAVGYREVLEAIEGELPLDRAIDAAVDASCSLAGRQRTFFRRDPRVRWLEWDDDADTRVDTAKNALQEAGWTS